MRLKPDTVGIVYALSAAGLFGAQSIAIKLAYRAGADVTTLLVVRASIGSAVLWLVIFALNIQRGLSIRGIRQMSRVGLIFALSGGMLVWALNRMAAGIVVLILYTYPTLVALLSIGLRREYLGRAKMAALILGLAGLVLLVGFPGRGADPLGLALAFGAALLTAVYALVFESSGTAVHPLASSAIILTAAAAVLLPTIGVVGLIHLDLGLEAWGWLFLIAGLLITASITLFGAALRRIGATRTAIAGTLEPVVTVALAVGILGERLSRLQFAGGALIVLAAALLPAMSGDARIRFPRNGSAADKI